MSHKRGFSMLESLIVQGGCVAVLAVLAALFVPNFLRARAQGQYTACKSNLANISTAVNMFASDHNGNYPANLNELLPNYLRVVPACPAAESNDPYRQSYKLGANSATFSCECQAVFHPKYGGPRISQDGPEEGVAIKTVPGGLEKTMAVFFALTSLYVFFMGLLWQPEPMLQAESLLASHPALARLNRACWWLLCMLAVAGLCYCAPVNSDEHWVERLDLFSFACLVGTVLAQLTVRLGWRLWRRLSPAPPYHYNEEELKVAEGPQLSERASAPVLWTEGERRTASGLALGLPLATLMAFVIIPALGRAPAQALKASSLGAAVGIILLFPAYLWAKRWTSDMFDRRLEWIPGSGVLLEHSHPWGQQIQRRLGTQADIEQFESLPHGVFSFRLDGRSYLLAPGELIDILRGSLPPGES